MLFERKSKKLIRFVWGVLTVLIIVSMVLFYTPIFSPPTQTNYPQVEKAPEPIPEEIPVDQEPTTDFTITLPE